MLRRSVGGAVVAVALLVLVALIVGLGGVGGVGNKQEEEKEIQPGIVSYELTGTGRASSLVYYIEGGKRDTQEQVTLPWRSRPIIADKTQPKGVAAFNRDSSAEITCKIYVDGKVIAESTSAAADPIVVCRTDIRLPTTMQEAIRA